MIFAAEEVTQEPLGFSSRDGKYTEPEIDHVDRTPLVKMPAMARCCWNRHLT